MITANGTKQFVKIVLKDFHFLKTIEYILNFHQDDIQ